MSVSLVTALAKHLNLHESEAADTLRSVATELRRALDESGRIEIPSVGIFFRENGGIGFEPDEALVRAANLDTDGLGIVSLPGRAGLQAAAPAPDEAPVADTPIPPALDVPEELPEFAEEPPEPAFLEAETPSFHEVEPDELFDADMDAVLEPASEPEEEEEEFVPPPPPDPVAYWTEEAFEAEEDEDEAAAFETEDGDERDAWQEADEPVAPLGAETEVTTFETPEFDVVPPDDEDLAFMPPSEPATAEPVHVTQRADRPPERHARPLEVIDERPAKRRRTLVPILLVGAILLIGLAAAAYFVLLRQPAEPAVVAEQRPRVAPTEVTQDTAAVAGGLTDSIAAPPTGAASETVAEATEPVEPEPEPPRPSEPPVIDVSAGGWTVVIGSATGPGEARQIAERFRSLGYTPAVLYGSYGGVTRYRIVVRQFATEAEAQAFLRGGPQGLPTDAWRLPITSEFEVISRQ